MNYVAANLLLQVKREVDEAGVFGPTEIVGDYLRCTAADSAAPAWYCLLSQAGRWHVALLTHDHELSESIEADLLEHDVAIEELIERELSGRGHTGEPPPVRRFRSAELLYTFRSPVPIGSPRGRNAASAAARCLLAYEAAFRPLGDMQVEKKEDDGD